jgi:hypothetical protein
MLAVSARGMLGATLGPVNPRLTFEAVKAADRRTNEGRRYSCRH